MKSHGEKSKRRWGTVAIVMVIGIVVMSRVKGKVVQKCISWCRGHMGSLTTCHPHDVSAQGCGSAACAPPQSKERRDVLLTA